MQTPKKWRPLYQMTDTLYTMVQNDGCNVRYAPLLAVRFRLIAPRITEDVERFLDRYRAYTDIEIISDKLRWCRYQNGWQQSEVAEMIGVSAEIYKAMEAGAYDHIPIVLTDKLAALYGIAPTDLLDEYGLFLQRGAAQSILSYRKSLGMSRTCFAQAIGVWRHQLADWEDGKKEVSRKSWEKYFADMGRG